MTQRWHKAAVLGSLWASMEIVVGSFLHNMKFPLTGTILSAVGISLLVAGHSLWKEHGIVWRAGIICAVMKSVSPSAVIFGPMIGITVEAFIVEIAIRLFGGGAVGYIAGGAVACTTPLIQKTVSYLFVYGMDIVILFEKLVEFAAKSLKLPFIESSDVIATVIAINLIFGGLSSVVGLIVGERARFLSDQTSRQLTPFQAQNLQSPVGNFSIVLLLLHFAVLLSGLIVQSIFFILYIPICIYLYPSVRKRFRKIRLWFEIGLVSLLAGLILGQYLLSDQSKGLLLGLQMFLRALFVVSIFDAISVELRNPVIVNLLFRKHLKNFSLALDTAFGALPMVIDSLQQEKFFLKHPIDSLSRLLARADSMIPLQSRSSKVFVLTGEKNSGKTRFAEEISKALKSEGLTVGGFLQHKVFKNNERHGYDLLDIQTQKSIPLCSIDAPDAGIVAGPFKFYPEGIRFGFELLSMAKVKDCDVVIVDEVGPLEMKGKGWYGAVSNLLKNYSGNLLIVIRKHMVEDMMKLLKITPVIQWNSDEIDIDDILKHIQTTRRENNAELLHESNRF
ncbi:MAG: nucleoside-triphosphatase [Bacteroidota bacterium]